MCKFLFVLKLPTPLGKYQGMQLPDHTVKMCSVCKKPSNCLPGGYTTLHSQQSQMRVPITLYPHQHLVFSVFWVLFFLIGMCWYCILICIFLTKYNEYLFKCLFAVCIYLTRYRRSLAPFLIRLLVS